ncbi:DUF6134 family protein [Kordiimonas lacus]|uniref:DUF3108 domain-containing protein n=1 Tax=Kordiimonas lacus TaxID=637679 RepID=A0A1G7A6Y2_9PROT|nr:DUF6134 family protein [Kordiimonas lacus]SDE10688.1 hypothetical protein SAMN04488071_2121 [Kordiimonas lacus]
MVKHGLWAVVFLCVLAWPAHALDALNHYDVLRGGKKIGDHEIRFSRTGQTLRVVSETRMKVKFLFITAYRYHYRSEEIWHGGVLESVSTEVNDNGERTSTRIEADGGDYVAIDADGSSRRIERAFVTTNHWNVGVVAANTLYNTITGRLNEVAITGTNVAQSPEAFALQVRGDLDIDTRYDVLGNWLGMTFTHDDGSEIEFRCTDCRNTLEIPS